MLVSDLFLLWLFFFFCCVCFCLYSCFVNFFGVVFFWKRVGSLSLTGEAKHSSIYEEHLSFPFPKLYSFGPKNETCL